MRDAPGNENNSGKGVEVEACLEGKTRILRDAKGRFLPGSCPNPKGRAVNVRDKANQIKLAFFEAFQKTGGIDGLIEWIRHDRRNRREFYKLIIPLLPKDVELQGDGIGETKILILVNDGNSERKKFLGRITAQPQLEEISD